MFILQASFKQWCVVNDSLIICDSATKNSFVVLFFIASSRGLHIVKLSVNYI